MYTFEDEITLASVGDKVMFKGAQVNSTFSIGENNYYVVSSDAAFQASGDIMSLLDPNLSATNVPERCFTNLFKECSHLQSIDGLKLGASSIEVGGA